MPLRICLAVIIAALSLPLGGCAILSSERPLIAQSDPAAAIEPGRYELYASLDADEFHDLSPAKRNQCLDQGYSRPKLDEWGWPLRQRIRLYYCPARNESDKSDYRIAVAPTGFRLSTRGRDDAGQEQELTWLLRLKPLSDGLRLWQVSDQLPPVGGASNGASYGLFRQRGTDTELLQVPCDGGQAIATDVQAAATSGRPLHRRRKPRPGPPPPSLKCEVVSLDAIRPNLIAYGSRQDTAPDLILRRIGD